MKKLKENKTFKICTVVLKVLLFIVLIGFILSVCLQRFSNNTLVQCKLVTGRTHQIRVHLSYIGFPVEGDPLYGGRNYKKLYDGGQLLTAVKLKLIHPRSKKEMEFQTEIPSYFQNVLDNLE